MQVGLGLWVSSPCALGKPLHLLSLSFLICGTGLLRGLREIRCLTLGLAHSRSSLHHSWLSARLVSSPCPRPALGMPMCKDCWGLKLAHEQAILGPLSSEPQCPNL